MGMTDMVFSYMTIFFFCVCVCVIFFLADAWFSSLNSSCEVDHKNDIDLQI